MLLCRSARGRWLAWLLLVVGSAGRLAAQHALCVEYKGQVYPVNKVRRDWVTIMVDGKPVELIAKASALVPVAEYLPVFIGVKEANAKTTYAMLDGGYAINNDFVFEAEFSSPYALADVFLVLAVESKNSGKMNFNYEIGQMVPDVPRLVRVRVPLHESIGEGKYGLHLFVGGREVFHSKMPVAYREAKLDRMILKRIAGVTDALPKPFVGPAPEYPAALRKTGGKGEATVAMRISARGAVLDPAVTSATDPAFGEAALVAVRQWRFLPAVKAGRPVETKAQMPFVFNPPASAVAAELN